MLNNYELEELVASNDVSEFFAEQAALAVMRELNDDFDDFCDANNITSLEEACALIDTIVGIHTDPAARAKYLAENNLRS